MIPRKEHPKPQFERENWLNLNGEWLFCIDNGRSGEARKIYADSSAFDRKITVPFCMESELSGIGIKDFTYGVWYKKEVEIPSEFCGKRTVLHIDAADYKTKVFINGNEAGVHEGGYVSFCFDITSFINAGKNDIVIYCEDDTKNPMIPRGKQSEEYYSHGCDYTRTTGIWQTVWLEFTEKTFVESVKYYPDYLTGSVTVQAKLNGSANLEFSASFEGRDMGSALIENAAGTVSFALKLNEQHLWNVGDGKLYDAEITFGEDKVKSYFGLRNVWFDGYKFMLNGKSVFQRLVLDQGFYPDGIYTAPTDDALLRDIKLSKKFGFNGARLHQKVFEERFLYYCDIEGYLVWGEYPNWGIDHSDPEAVYHVLPEWIEEINRDFNHPAIIGWCPLNETWNYAGRKQFDPYLSLIYRATKAIDSTRPCIDTSGNYHVETDIFDVHDYEQDSVKFAEHYKELPSGNIDNFCNDRQTYEKGMPIFVSEYGGIRWSKEMGDDSAWGYGNAPKTPQEYHERYKELTDALLDNPLMFGFCYTQLTDVEQEQNGCYFYDRSEKFDTEFFFEVNTRKAAIED